MKKIILISIFLICLIPFSKKAEAVEIECRFPSCFPIKIPTIPCFPPCLPTCSPKPTPTEVVPTPTSGLPIPTTPFWPTMTPTGFIPSPQPTTPPSVRGGEEQVSGGLGGGGPSGCGAQTPPTPYLRSILKINVGEVELLWDPVEPVTHYSISYGPSAGSYLYGVPNTGKVTSFKVGALGAGNYCFVVRAVNDCAPSAPSNELCTGAVESKILGTKVLGATGQANDFVGKVLFIIGIVCTNLGGRICFSKKQKVFF